MKEELKSISGLAKSAVALRKMLEMVEQCLNYSCKYLEELSVLLLSFRKSIIGEEPKFQDIMTLIEKKGIWQIASLMRSKHEPCAEEATAVLLLLLHKYPEVAALINEIVSNFLVEKGIKNIHFISRLLILAWSLLKMGYLQESKEAFYQEFVLPNLITVANVKIIPEIIKDFISQSIHCMTITLKWILSSLQSTDSGIHPKLLIFIPEILDTYMDLKDKDNADGSWTHFIYLFRELLACIIKTENHLVVDALSTIFERGSTRTFFEKHITVLLPRIFPILYKQSKIFWRLEQRCKFLMITKYVLECDEDLFEECLVEYNISKNITQ